MNRGTVTLRRNVEQVKHCAAEALSVITQGEDLWSALDDLDQAKKLIEDIIPPSPPSHRRCVRAGREEAIHRAGGWTAMKYKYTAYLIMEPGADRPYFSHTYPTEYQKKPGSKVFELQLSISGFGKVDGRIVAHAVEVAE